MAERKPTSSCHKRSMKLRDNTGNLYTVMNAKKAQTPSVEPANSVPCETTRGGNNPPLVEGPPDRGHEYRRTARFSHSSALKLAVARHRDAQVDAVTVSSSGTLDAVVTCFAEVFSILEEGARD